jgi:putative dimethyl sulfoxide reductase chaperone
VREFAEDQTQLPVGREDREALLNLMEIRYNVYAFLSKIFGHELSALDIKTLSGRARELQTLPEILDASDDTKLVEALKLLLNTTKGFDERNTDKVALELATEYAGLFLGVRQKPAHPSESVYLSSTRLLMQKERDEVLFAYQKAGFEKAGSNFKEPEDHIALELAFMAALSKDAAERLRSDNTVAFTESLLRQKDFLQKHLSLWVQDLAKDIEESARVDFYAVVADITASFVDLDKELVVDTIENLSTCDEKP